MSLKATYHIPSLIYDTFSHDSLQGKVETYEWTRMRIGAKTILKEWLPMGHYPSRNLCSWVWLQSRLSFIVSEGQ